MAKRLSLTVKPRGTEENAKALRNSKEVPAVVYGHGLESQSIKVNDRVFLQTYTAAGHTSLINMIISGEKETTHPVIIRAIQRHPLTDNIIHIDFYQVRLDKKITANVPLRFEGTSSAVKDLGGVLVRTIDELEMQALPTDIPHDIEVDISVLKDFEKVIHLKDLNIPTGVEILHHEADDVVALVQPPRSDEELEALEEEATEDVESVEGVEDKEEEGEEDAQPEAEADTSAEQKEE